MIKFDMVFLFWGVIETFLGKIRGKLVLMIRYIIPEEISVTPQIIFFQ